MFKDRNTLIKHRKAEHPDTCSPCKKYLQNKCTFGESCWFAHKDNNSVQNCSNGYTCENRNKVQGCKLNHTDSTSNVNTEKQGFQERKENLKEN